MVKLSEWIIKEIGEGRFILKGYVTGHIAFSNGIYIKTSMVKDIRIEEGCFIITTLNTRYRLNYREISLEYPWVLTRKKMRRCVTQELQMVAHVYDLLALLSKEKNVSNALERFHKKFSLMLPELEQMLPKMWQSYEKGKH